MAKITAIKAAIINQLGPAEFQEFCDTLLSQMDKYGKIHELGMKSGTLKTTIGNPDTYFRKDNGKYVFVVYTTQQNNIYNKIKEDIEKCFDQNKTGIRFEEIDEIICCHTASNLDAGKDLLLHEMCKKKGIELSIYGVDEIAQLIYRKYPRLAKDYFNISIDTSQILSLDDFISLYDSNEFAAPLNTIFQNRKEELKTIVEAINQNNVVIIQGQAGIGKTRLAIEAIKKASIENGNRLLCVKNNNLDIYDDLVTYTKESGDYLFFIDDANDLIGLPLIIQYIENSNDGNKYKVVLTVRDYAKHDVIKIIKKYTMPAIIEIHPFDESEINDFLDINLGIKNEQFISRINCISEGNPRIAYMLGKIAIDTQRLDSLADVSEVYEQYYSSIIYSKLEEKRDLCITAGLLSMVKVVVLDKQDGLFSIFDAGVISKEKFMESIYQLSNMEVVEIHLNKIAKISDQCFSDYMLYYTFFDKKYIPFSVALEMGFKFFREGLVQSTNTLLNFFSKDTLHQYIESEVTKVWKLFENNNDPCFDDFVKFFHVFRPEDSFVIAHDKIQKIPEDFIDNTLIDFDKNVMRDNYGVLDILTGYQNSKYIEVVVELLIEYIRKSKDNAITGYKWLKENYPITYNSKRYDYYTEISIDTILKNHINDEWIVQQFILAHIGDVLSIEFTAIEANQRNKIQMTRFRVGLSEGVKKYRKLCWEMLNEFAMDNSYENDVLLALRKYCRSIYRAGDNEIVLFDASYLESIISKLKTMPLLKSLIIEDINNAWSDLGITRQIKDKSFSSDEWVLFSVLKNEYIKSDLSYDEYEKNKMEMLVKYANALNDEDIEKFIITSNSIVKQLAYIKDYNSYSIIKNIQCVLDTISTDSNKVEIVFKTLVLYGKHLNIYPGNVLKSLISQMSLENILMLLNEFENPKMNNWKFIFFQQIPEELIDKKIYELFMAFLSEDTDKNIKESAFRDLGFVRHFLKIDKNAFVNVSKKILNKREYNSFIVKMYFTLLFHESCFTPEELIDLFQSDTELLKEIYFFMIENGAFEDVNGVFLLEFLSIDKTWVDMYAESIWESDKTGRDVECYKLKALWLSEKYILFYDRIYKKIIKKSEDHSRWRVSGIVKSFLIYEKNDKYIAERQEEWVVHIIQSNSTNEEMLVPLFEALAEMNTELRKRAFCEFIKLNDDYDLFDKLPLDSEFWGGFVDSIIPDLNKRIQYLESLLSYVSQLKYIRHAKKIRNRIDWWKEQIRREEFDNIYMKLYREY